VSLGRAVKRLGLGLAMYALGGIVVGLITQVPPVTAAAFHLVRAQMELLK
jgi:hypothetical protein